MRFVLILFISIIGASCKHSDKTYTYPNNLSISNPKGEPIDSLSTYFPFQLKLGDSLTIAIDSSQQGYSEDLYFAKESILSNYYLGHNIYRLTWLRSFNPPVFISLHRDGEKVWLEAKTLDRMPPSIPFKSIIFSPPGLSKKDSIENMRSQLRWRKEEDSINNDRINAKIISKKPIQLSTTEWSIFEILLANCKFYLMKPTQSRTERGFDGSQWIIESHKKDSYWMVDRWSPKGAYRECGEYLIKLSELNEEIY